MPVRLVDGVAGSIERWLANLGGVPDAVTEPERHPDHSDGPSTPSASDYKCPVCDAPRSDYGVDREQFDEDYDYYWGEFRIPLWLALIWNVPWRQRLDIFVIGFLLGLVIAGVALLWGLLLSQY
jgi:hypothetical protein